MSHGSDYRLENEAGMLVVGSSNGKSLRDRDEQSRDVYGSYSTEDLVMNNAKWLTSKDKV